MYRDSNLKKAISVFDIPIPKGCDVVDENNPLAHIYLMAYYQSSWLDKEKTHLERFEVDYSPQEGLMQRRFVDKSRND